MKSNFSLSQKDTISVLDYYIANFIYTVNGHPVYYLNDTSNEEKGTRATILILLSRWKIRLLCTLFIILKRHSHSFRFFYYLFVSVCRYHPLIGFNDLFSYSWKYSYTVLENNLTVWEKTKTEQRSGMGRDEKWIVFPSIFWIM